MKILLIFLLLSMVSLIIMGFAAFFTISDIGVSAQESSATLGEEAVRDSTAALTNQTEEYMVRVAMDQARLVDEIFWSTEAELTILTDHARSVQNNPSYESQVRSYSRQTPPQNPLQGTVVLQAPGSTVKDTDPEYLALAGMDDLLAAVYRTDGDLTSVYVATDTGIMRQYPWVGDAEPAYDPRARSWFTEAKRSDQPVWTEPYVDASGHGLILTCSKSVRTRYGTWVVASDVTVDKLNEYTNLTLGGKGYALLMNDDGTIISRPGLSANGTSWNQPFPEENVFSSPDPGLRAVGYNMTTGKTGLARVQFNGIDTIVAYAPVESLNWSYAVSMPTKDVIAPIMNTEGHIVAATVRTSAQILHQTDRFLYIFAGVFVFLFLIVISLSWLLSRMITRPVEVLREGAQVIGQGNLDFRLDIHSGDEFEALAGSFNQMASDLKDNIENLNRTTAEKERYAKEMEIAKEIQDSFLPETVVEIPGYDLAAVTIPAMEIGGDLYDFIPVLGNNTGFVIADVSGKGVSAALYMAVSHTLLHACGQEDPDPSRAVHNANHLIYDDGRSSMFITVFYGVLNPRSKTFAYVNAGHNPPLLLRDGEEPSWLTGAKGIALGVIPDVSIAPVTLEFQKGDILVLFTDGVTEAFNELDEYFGEDRLRDCISRNKALPAQKIIDALLSEIQEFSGSAPQSDDITLIVIRVL